MGLAIETGILADLKVHDPEGAEWVSNDLESINSVLAKNGLPPHHEPTEGLVDNSRAPIVGFPYSFLHYLRRAAAYAFRDPKWRATQLPETDDPADDPVVTEEYDLLRSHLLCHSDAEGFYLPVDFQEVIFEDEEIVPGGMLGSSFRLMEELVQVAPSLGIELSGGTLTDSEADRINALVDEQDNLWIELTVWMSMFEAARISLEQKTAICFC